ncbi:MAG: NADH-quinone oxidoreductase subunit C [Candidatus Aminicenantia bacterium]
MERKEKLKEEIPKNFSEYFVDFSSSFGDDILIIKKEGIIPVLFFLKDYGFDLLLDITAVDYYQQKPRFEVVYHLLSLKEKMRLRIKVSVEDEVPKISSVSSIWKNADWLEREVWDMYGINFEGHPNLKRILMYEEFKGHPLRKDYPFRKRQPRINLLYPED